MTFAQAIYPRNPRLPAAILQPFLPVAAAGIDALDRALVRVLCGTLSGHQYVDGACDICAREYRWSA